MRRRLARETRDTFRSLANRNFRLFFAGQLVSQAGTWMQSVAIVWVVLELTDSGVALGLATAAQFLPILLLGAWGGVVADRVDRHRFMMATQAAFTMVAAAFFLLTVTGHASVGAIYALSALFGTVTALDNPARRALVVELVVERDVPNAVGLNSALMTGSRVIGPAIAGVLITGVGAEWCFLVNAVTYLAVLGALAAIDRSQLRSPVPVRRGRGQLREGLRYVWATPELRLPLVLLAVIGTLAFEFQVTLPLLAERTFAGDARTFTILYSSMSAGSVVGALLVARRTDVDTAFLVRAGLWLAASMTMLAIAPNVPLAVAAVVPVGMASIFLVSGSNTVLQLKADPSMRGRALALTAVVFLGSTPIGGPAAGFVSEHLGARAGIALGAVASGLAALWTRRALRRLPSEPPPLGLPADADAPAVVRT